MKRAQLKLVRPTRCCSLTPRAHSREAIKTAISTFVEHPTKSNRERVARMRREDIGLARTLAGLAEISVKNGERTTAERQSMIVEHILHNWFEATRNLPSNCYDALMNRSSSNLPRAA